MTSVPEEDGCLPLVENLREDMAPALHEDLVMSFCEEPPSLALESEKRQSVIVESLMQIHEVAKALLDGLPTETLQILEQHVWRDRLAEAVKDIISRFLEVTREGLGANEEESALFFYPKVEIGLSKLVPEYLEGAEDTKHSLVQNPPPLNSNSPGKRRRGRPRKAPSLKHEEESEEVSNGTDSSPVAPENPEAFSEDESFSLDSPYRLDSDDNERVNGVDADRHDKSTFSEDILIQRETRSRKGKTTRERRVVSANHVREKRFLCLCQKAFMFAYQLRLHISKSKGKGHKAVTTSSLEGEEETDPTSSPLERTCKRCGKRKVRQNHVCEKPFSCEECGKCFCYAYLLKIHVASSHSAAKQDWDGFFRGKTCSVCGKRMVQRNHICEARYQCERCKKNFPYLYMYNRHKARAKGGDCALGIFQPPDQQMIREAKIGETCKHCGKRVVTDSHACEKPYQCDLCGRSFCYPYLLKLHSSAHTSEMPYVCETCGKQFRTRTNLCIHRKKHTGVKPHQCSDCGKAFTFKETLKVHIRTHTGERPYHCDICGKNFVRSGHLRVHLAMHRGEKPHRCHICGFCCSQKGDLKRHILRHGVQAMANSSLSQQQQQELSLQVSVAVDESAVY